VNAAERERWLARYRTYDPSQDILPVNAISRRVYPAYLWDRVTNKVERASGFAIAFSLAEIPGQLPGSALADLNLNEELRNMRAEDNTDITGGSYRVEGLRARRSTNPPPIDKILITVEKGKGRISGLKIVRAIEEDVALDIAVDFAGVTGEVKTFNTGTNIYALNKAVGANRLPIKQVVQLSATVQVTRAITKGATNGLDALLDTPVSSIVTIQQGITTFIPTSDYVLNGDFVDWSLGGTEPVGGTSYNVTYRYTKSMVLTADFLLIDSDSDGDLDSIDFSPAGDNPVNGTTFSITYNYYLPRIDRIILRTDGELTVLKGTPADNPISPQQPTEFLGIAEITLGANSVTDIRVRNLENSRVTMAMMRDAIQRQEDQRRNDALQSLFNQVKFQETAAFIGIFAESFASSDIADVTFSRNAGLGGVSPGTLITYDALIDLFNLQLLLPYTIASHNLTSIAPPAGQLQSVFNRDFLTIPFSEVLEIDQDQWSEERNINPFANFAPPSSLLTLVPDRDIAVNVVTSVNTEMWLRIQGGRYLIQASPRELELLNVHPLYQVTGRSVEEVRRMIEDRGGLFMRQLVVEVRGKRFVPSEDNITARFDGKLVALTPINGTPAGTTAGTVKARASTFDLNNQMLTLGGDWEATFTIPADVPTGVRTLVTQGPTTLASASYDGQLIERQITIFERDILDIWDPIAQTFGFSQPTTVTRVVVPFSSIGGPGEPPVQLELRNVALPGGFPGITAMETVLKKTEEIAVGPASANHFIFGNPMYIPAQTLRAIVLATSSSLYTVFSATLGRGGQNPVAFITANPNVRGNEPAGILLESLNAVNWEAASRSALRYKIYRASFSPDSWLYLDRISTVQYSHLFLNVDQIIPEGTNIVWQVSIDGLAINNGGKKWIDIVPSEMLTFGVIATTVDVRAHLATSSDRITPYINFRNLSLHGLLFKASGKYVSRATTTAQDVESVKVYCDSFVPAGGATVIYVSNAEDGAANPIWEQVETLDSSVDLGDGFSAVVLSQTLNNANGNKTSLRKIRLRVDMSTGNQALTPRLRNLAVSLI